MMHRKARKSVLAAATVVLVGGSTTVLFAQQSPPTMAKALDTANFTLGAPVYAEAASDADQANAQEGLLQSELRAHGYGADFLDQYGVRIGGHASVGYTYNFQRPSQNRNGFGRLFDNSSDDPQIDQIDLWAMREAIVGPSNVDMGFGLEVIYGSDARFIHANGLNFYGSGAPPVGQQYPDEQIDLFQAYVTLNAPVGNGLLFTIGKFATPFGLEHVNASQNWFYSHSYIFSLSTPFSLTGVTARYVIDDQWSVMGGVVVGWDQSIEDNNDFPSFIAQVAYKYSPEWDFLVSAIVGPERDNNRSDYRWLLDGIVNWHLADDWKVAAEVQLGYEDDIGTELTDRVVQGQLQRQFLATGDDTFWFAAAAYSSYKIDNDGMFTLNLRGEYFADSKGARFFPTEVYEATAALDIVPFLHDKWGRNLTIRPEVRVDYALDAVFDSGRSNAQQTISLQAIYKF